MDRVCYIEMRVALRKNVLMSSKEHFAMNVEEEEERQSRTKQAKKV